MDPITVHPGLVVHKDSITIAGPCPGATSEQLANVSLPAAGDINLTRRSFISCPHSVEVASMKNRSGEAFAR